VLQMILSGLFPTEPDLLIARLISSCAICQVFERDLVGVSPLCVRGYRKWRDRIVVALEILGVAELASCTV
jgi:hypothetical protein